MKSKLIIFAISSTSFAQIYSMQESTVARSFQNAFNNERSQNTKRSALPLTPDTIKYFMSQGEGYKKNWESIERNDRWRCPKNSAEKLELFRKYKEEINSQKAYEGEIGKSFIAQYKYSLGICDSIRYGYRDVDSTFLPAYLSSYIDTASSSNLDSVIKFEILNRNNQTLNSNILHDIAINSGYGYSVNNRGMMQAFNGYILSRIYERDLSKLYLKFPDTPFPRTPQDIESTYFKSGKFENDANYFFTQIRSYLYSCIVVKQQDEKERNEKIIQNRNALSLMSDSLIRIFTKKYPQYSSNEISPMFRNGIEISAFKVDRQASTDELLTSWAWRLIDYLNKHKTNKKFVEAMLENSVLPGMTFEDVYAVHGEYIAQARKQYSGNGIEIYITPNEQNTNRIYSFKKNKLISVVDEE